MTITMNSRSSIVGLIPSMIGQQPDNVLTLLLSMPDGEAVMTVPPPVMDKEGENEGQVHAWAYAVAKAIPDEATAIRIVQWMPVGEDPSLAPSLWVLSVLTDYMDIRHRDEFGTNGEWMFLLDGQRYPVDHAEVDRVRSELIFTDALVAKPDPALAFEPDPIMQAQVDQLLNEPTVVGLRQPWRDRQIDWAAARLSNAEPLSLPEIAQLIDAMNDIKVRDVTMFRLGLWGNPDVTPPEWLESHLLAAFIAAPDGDQDAVGTLLAVVYFLQGQDTKASLVLDRVARGYNLGRLMRMMVTAGLSPATWQAGLADLTEEECRTGQRKS